LFKNKKPLIGLPTCVRLIDGQSFHIIGEKYLTSIIEGMGAIPIIFPAIADLCDINYLIDRLDGLVLTGSLSNVYPTNYGELPISDDILFDKKRDHTTLPLIQYALSTNIPLLCICRGMQELNVSCGGTLYQNLSQIHGRMEHDIDRNLSLSEQYKTRHSIHLESGGLLAQLNSGKDDPMVNSLHTQGVRKLGQGLCVEAIAPDGQIEAIRSTNQEGFALGVQWHPEWQVKDNSFYLSIFHAFALAINKNL